MQTSRLLKCNKLLTFVLILALIFGMLSIPTGVTKANFNTTSKGVFNPTVIVRVSENEILTYYWRAGTSVRLTIDDPANGVGVDYSDTLPVIGGSNLTEELLFKINNFKLTAGQLITLTDGISTDTVWLSPVYITHFSNSIYGISPPGTMIQAEFKTGTSTLSFQTTGQSNGTWQIIAESFYWEKIQRGKLTLCVWDADKDVVRYTQPYKTPYFEVNLSSNIINGWDWLAGGTVSLAIDDPATATDNDFIGTMKMTGTYFYPHYVLDLGSFKLSAGQIITLTDGTRTKTHVVQNLTITDVDLAKDSLSGTTNTTGEINTWIVDNNGRVYQRSDTVENGLWTSDFTHAGDQSFEIGNFNITQSTQLFSKQADEDGDATLVTIIATGNLPPIARVGEDFTAVKGITLTFDGSASSDPEGNLLTFEWDMDNDGVFDDATGMNPTAVFEEEGVYPIVLRVKDDGGLFSTDSLSVTIKNDVSIINLPPIAEAGEDIMADIEVSVTFDGSHSIDPEGKPLIYEWDMDNDSQFDDATGMNPSYVFADSGVFVIALRITDEGNLTATDTLSITISNVAPTIGELVMPASPQKVNNALMFSASLTNFGQDDALIAFWDWNDGTTSAGTLEGQTITGSHIYKTPGVYVVKLTVTDKDGEIVLIMSDELVIISPSAASVFGSGWINLPAGSTIANLGEVGKINFDFNASYRRASASVPTGKTNITIKGKEFKFVSSSYSWLIINGKTSILEGSGTLNGGGNFGLLISIQDGAWFKPNSDKLRIKIWNKENGEVIYDTQPGAANDALPTTTVKGFIFTINK